ncbi:MAG: hypothetical protein HOV68_00365 [Streptomycetaceae bacterium]|nr:hypothetical protein [Streptomycetaceae bacterium]
MGDLWLRADTETGALSAELTEFHCVNGGRGFGGWTAALAALAAARSAGDRQLHTCQVMFTRPALPGELTLSVTELVAGRTAAAYQVTMSQDERPVLAAQCWFTDASLLAAVGPVSRRIAEVPPPGACPRVTWIEQEFPCLGGFTERAVEFPLSAEEFDTTFRDGGDRLTVWMAPAQTTEPAADAGLAERLTDLMMFDCHLMDAALRGGPGVTMVSLDLTATWHTTARRPSLTLFDARGRTDGLLAATYASLIAPDGTVRATGTSQCRVYPRQT